MLRTDLDKNEERLIYAKPSFDRTDLGSQVFPEIHPLVLIGVTLHAYLLCAVVMLGGIVVVAEDAVQWLLKVIRAVGLGAVIHHVLLSIAAAEGLLLEHQNVSLGLGLLHCGE